MLLACAKPVEKAPAKRESSPKIAARELLLAEPVVPDAIKAKSAPVVHESPPAVAASGGCAVRRRLVLDPRATLGSVVADRDRALVLLFVPRGSGGTLELSHSGAVALEPMLNVALDTPLALLPVAQSMAAGALSVALVDTQGTLSLIEIHNGKVSGPRVLARGVDRRFLPSMANLGAVQLVAFTKTVNELMHTFVARVSPDAIELADVTPTSHGAAAATFVLGAPEPTLVMLDARAGVSPLLEVGFDANGKSRPAIVRTPVSQPYAPPWLAAFEVPGADIQVAYTAIGRAAATAVGLVPLRRVEAPRALLPSLGYGPLAFSVARGARALVFATESPVSAATDAVRSVVVKVIDAGGEGATLTLACQVGTCARPTLAASATERAFFLLHAEGAALVLSLLDCDA